MPRAKKPGAAEPKKRSRNGCWPCKNRKIKCGEEKPNCLNCERQGDTCDYSIRLNWFRSDFAQLPPGSTRPALTTRSSSEGEYPRPGGKRKIQDGACGVSQSLLSPPKPSPSPQQVPKQGHSRHGSASSRPPSNGQSRSPEQVRVGSTQTSPRVQCGTAVDPVAKGPNGLPTISQDSLGSVADRAVNNVFEKQTPGFLDHMSAAQLSRIRDHRIAPYPSPVDSATESPPFYGAPFSTPTFPYQAQMLPPYQGPPPTSPFSFSFRRFTEDAAEPQSKRMRLDLPSSEGFSRPAPLSGVLSAAARTSPYMSSIGLNSPRFGALTPATSATGDEYNASMPFNKPASTSHQENLDLRRLSVKSLLSDDSDQPDSGGDTVPPPSIDPYIHHGVDRGFHDLDLPRNNDSIALNGLTPSLSTPGLARTESDGQAEYYTPVEFGFGIHTANTAHSEGGYYTKPVSVSIPMSLGRLPSTLQDNPMNLLYFHHFLNHTARILVPHDCIENPFRSILPQMALQDVNLLHLLLAYSASHRARLLKHPEPANRIALWVQDIFPALSRALNDPSAQISNANLATAIMLASLEIISPNTFEVPIPWQSHLNVARRMLMARGGARSIRRKDTVSYFLSRWFAYLDVLGSLSGGKSDQPLFGGDYWASDDLDNESNFKIDCLIGFTCRCIGILAKIAELARQCLSARIDSDGAVIEDWTPPSHIFSAAQTLRSALHASRMHTHQGCPHRHEGSVDDAWNAEEMVATNEAFHWAGLIHLDRRVIGKASSDPEIQHAVGKIVDALGEVRKGSPAEACLLFPIFTAGCHARDEERRKKLMERLKTMELSGMMQVHKARTLIERVWDTGKPWETLACGEFFG